jgi:hypothetical protein
MSPSVLLLHAESLMALKSSAKPYDLNAFCLDTAVAGEMVPLRLHSRPLRDMLIP